jgi:hypothetical protein
MGKVWVLDTETKGTGANMRPLEKLVERPPRREPPARPAVRPSRAAAPRRTARRAEPQRTATALPPGHVRKKATGEIGQVQSVDARAGTATVRWLRGGSTSTVPLSAISTR